MKLLIDNVTEEKKRKIINSAMVEFATNGYDKASTNVIVRNAGISKGAIYQYFMNKEVMFYYLFDYAQLQMKSYIVERVDYTNPNLFIRIESYMENLINLLDEFPSVLKFIHKAKIDENKSVRENILNRKAESISELEQFLIKDIDINLIKPGMDVNKILFIIYSTLEKLIEECIKTESLVESIREKISIYINFFRELFLI